MNLKNMHIPIIYNKLKRVFKHNIKNYYNINYYMKNKNSIFNIIN